MIPETRLRFNPKARVPFTNQLAREFAVSKGHVWAVCTGERKSPQRISILARQKELLKGSPAGAVQEKKDRIPKDDRSEPTCSRHHTELFLLLTARQLSFGDLAAKTGFQRSTLHQIASGSNRSRHARRVIEQICGIQIWSRSPAKLQPDSGGPAQPSQPDCSSSPVPPTNDRGAGASAGNPSLAQP